MDYLNNNHETNDIILNFNQSKILSSSFNKLIPGGGHTYAKGDDQFPENFAPYIVKGKGCKVWDVDGNEFIEYGMGLRSVTLGHAFDYVDETVRREIGNGLNFTRPAMIELEAAETFLDIVKNGDMVKFAKNGSDVTSAAVLLARAYTGRDMIAICSQPFFSFDDWFIGSTPMNAGIPKGVQDLTIKFYYNDLKSLEELFEQFPNRIACVILEAEKEIPPMEGFLQNVKNLCEKNGTLLIFDEIINGFRWDLGGAQEYYNIKPDLSTFAKGMANGYSVAALTGRREIMELGGLSHNRDRVFLLSATYGAESASLRGAISTMQYYKQYPVIETLHNQGAKLEAGLLKIVKEIGLEENFELIGKPWCLVYSTKDNNKKNSQYFRSLFLQETIKRGLLAPSFVISYSHEDIHINKTLEIIFDALLVYKRALSEGIDKYLLGRPVKPVFRKKN